MWMRLMPSLQLVDRRSLTGWNIESQLEASLDVGSYGGSGGHRAARFALSWHGRVGRAAAEASKSRVRWGISAGYVSRAAALEDHFLLGVGPDVHFPLRAHPLFGEGGLGSTPLAGEFVLGGLTAGRDLHAWKWLELGLVTFLDTGTIPRAFNSRSPLTVLDTGAGIEIGVPGASISRFTVSYGRDWQKRQNVFYLSASLR
jgi:hypothetical protein